MVIGYQGSSGSNCEAAALAYIKENGLKNTQLKSLKNSQNVVDALENNLIDLGLMAIENTISGVVVETQMALDNKSLNEIGEIVFPIHHCLFKKTNVENSKLTTVASHPQALIQTRQCREKCFPDLIELEMSDAVVSAYCLSRNLLPDSCTVICRKDAGEFLGLELIAENIEDKEENYTTFKIYKKD